MSTASQELPDGWSLCRVASTGSTNADLLVAAVDGAAAGTVLVADAQTAGQGRVGRRWQTPAGSGLALSVLLRPLPDAWSRIGWLPLLTGLAVLEASAALVPAAELALKWPNDIVAGPAKLAGVLVQAAAPGPHAPGPHAPGPHARGPDAEGRAVVVGVGVNVAAAPTAGDAQVTCLAGLAGAPVDRERLLPLVLTRLAARIRAWDRGEDPVGDYRARCATIGAPVRVVRPDGILAGTAVAVDDTGRLLVQTADGRQVALQAGDVTHLR